MSQMQCWLEPKLPQTEEMGCKRNKTSQNQIPKKHYSNLKLVKKKKKKNSQEMCFNHYTHKTTSYDVILYIEL